MPSLGGRAGRWARELIRPAAPATATVVATPMRPSAAPATATADTTARRQTPVEVVRRRGRLHAAVVTMRPRQWLKNALVIAAAGAAGALGHDDVPVRVVLAFIAF